MMALRSVGGVRESDTRLGVGLSVFGLLSLFGGLAGLYVISNPGPPDPSQSEEAWKAYDRWIDVWLAYASVAFVGLLTLIAGLIVTLLAGRVPRE